MLPNPWQRGQAPNGLLKLNRRGSGSLPGRWQLVHSNAPENRCRRALAPSLVARNLFENHLAGLAISNLRRIHDARAVFGADDDPVQQHEHRKREVQIQQRLRRGELEDLPR